MGKEERTEWVKVGDGDSYTRRKWKEESAG